LAAGLRDVAQCALNGSKEYKKTSALKAGGEETHEAKDTPEAVGRWLCSFNFNHQKL
jgi:hypothetical protein